MSDELDDPNVDDATMDENTPPDAPGSTETPEQTEGDRSHTPDLSDAAQARLELRAAEQARDEAQATLATVKTALARQAMADQIAPKLLDVAVRRLDVAGLVGDDGDTSELLDAVNDLLAERPEFRARPESGSAPRRLSWSAALAGGR